MVRVRRERGRAPRVEVRRTLRKPVRMVLLPRCNRAHILQLARRAVTPHERPERHEIVEKKSSTRLRAKRSAAATRIGRSAAAIPPLLKQQRPAAVMEPDGAIAAQRATIASSISASRAMWNRGRRRPRPRPLRARRQSRPADPPDYATRRTQRKRRPTRTTSLWTSQTPAGASDGCEPSRPLAYALRCEPAWHL